MKVHVWYGPDGVILAVGSVQSNASFTPGSDTEGVKVIEVDVPSAAEPARLHEAYRVNVSTEELVRQSS
jgi:hypothetical protein